MNLIPPIGASGIYRLSEPYSNAINVNISYTCMAVRKISDIIALGLDPYETYYKPYNVDRSRYETDLNSSVCIISLQSSNGLWAYVPSSYIESYPQVNGIPYASIALMVNLGALPDNLNLSYLHNAINSLVASILGVQPTTKTVVTSPKTMVSQETHISAETARQQNITTATTNYSSSQQYMAENTQLRQRIQQLENYILTIQSNQ